MDYRDYCGSIGRIGFNCYWSDCFYKAEGEVGLRGHHVKIQSTKTHKIPKTKKEKR